jgi:cyclophilin family peptidyl-prolyl cis-trans isomerase
MSALPPNPLEGTQTPNQIEFLWERYKNLVWVIMLAIVVALGANYGWKMMQQREVDATWSGIATAIGLDRGYTNEEQSFLQPSLVDSVRDLDMAGLEAFLAKATPEQRPFVLLAIARKAMLERNWERAESALTELEKNHANHSLVKTSDYPIQVREVVDPKAKPEPGRRPALQPATSGSAVSMMRAQIEAAKAYQVPAHFAPVTPPADAKKVQFHLSNGQSFTIALMAEHAPRHVESFLRLAAEREGKGFWENIAVDEIRRPTEFNGQPRELHLGFESTRDDDRTKWISTEPSKNMLDFETNTLSHFAGAVAGRNEAQGTESKSCADRFWIVADDAARYDGERVIFGYVVEGLEAVRSICEESMSAQEEQAGRGKPAATIRVTSVQVLP